MAEMVQGGSEWDVVSKSLIDFLNDPANADIGVGINYFPGVASSCKQGDPGCFCMLRCGVATTGGACNVSHYSRPSIPFSLPPNHAAVAMDIPKHGPGGGTPTRPALEGAMQYVTTWATSNPARKPVVVLATDGDPAGCSMNSPQDVANVAAAALAGPSKIQTFVIGVGNSLTSLNLIAQAGGNPISSFVVPGAN